MGSMHDLYEMHDEGETAVVTLRGELDAHDAPRLRELFAAAVAEFGMLLRGSEHKGQASFAHVAEQARRFRGADPDGDRSEFVNLVEMARGLRGLKDAYR